MRTRWSGPRLLQLGMLLVAPTLPACTDEGGSSPEPSRSELEGMVAGAAAASLDTEGRFRLAPPESSSVPILTDQQALAIAAAWPKDFGYHILPFLEETRGGRINISALTPCNSPYYADGAYEVPVAGVADRFTRPYGAWWIISLCGRGGTPEVSLAISATSTDVSVDQNGIVLPAHSGNNFFAVGVPKHWNGPIGESAEAAVARAFGHTKKRIISVPQLIALSPRQGYPQGAFWRIRLEGPVTLTESLSGRQVTTQEVFVGPRRFAGVGNEQEEVSIPAAQQQDSLSFQYWVVNEDPDSQRGTRYVYRKAGMPTNLEATDPTP